MNVLHKGDYTVIEADVIKATDGTHWRVGRRSPLPAERMPSSSDDWFVLVDGDLIMLSLLDWKAHLKQERAAEKAAEAEATRQAELIVHGIYPLTVDELTAQVSLIGGTILLDQATGTCAILAPRGVQVPVAITEAIEKLGHVLATSPACAIPKCRRKATMVAGTGLPVCAKDGGREL